ncbi:MAG: helix-turn-helix domain-containing protein [Actinomycetes bacterium]
MASVTKIELLTPLEVAGAMRVSTMTVYRLVKSGEIPAIRVGKHLRIRLADLNNYLESRMVTPSQEGGAWPAE